MIKLDEKDLKDLQSDLKTFANRAYPFATKETLNKTAFHAMKVARNDVEVSMVLRNRWTVGSIRAQPTRSLNVNQQFSVVGSTEEYMAHQEFGRLETTKGKHGVAIPTGYSAGQEGVTPRTRLPRKANRMQNIRIAKFQQSGKTRKQRMVMTVRRAVETNRRFVYLDLGKRRGIFKVRGGDIEYASRGWPGKASLKMLQDLSHRSVRIPKSPWLNPSTKKASNKMPEFYREAILFQLKRNKIFDKSVG